MGSEIEPTTSLTDNISTYLGTYLFILLGINLNKHEYEKRDNPSYPKCSMKTKHSRKRRFRYTDS